MKSVNTYLMFNGNCRQAMTFYEQCLGTGVQLEMVPFPDDQGHPSTDPKAGIMHAKITKSGHPLLMASDGSRGDKFTVGDNFQVSIECESIEEIERLFSAFCQNGQVRLALADMFWGARFGMVTDQFGIQWMFNCEKPK
jgi:PhnB protein